MERDIHTATDRRWCQASNMKIRTVHILAILTALGTGVTYFVRHTAPCRHAVEIVTVPQAQTTAAPKREESKPSPVIRTATAHLPKPVLKPVIKKSVPAPPPTIAAPKKPPESASVNNGAARIQWQEIALQFERQQQELNREKDQIRRMNLIRKMARNVRMNTLGTIDWAMSLEDPAERQAALDAINQNALSGIGARIKLDETGLPSIGETTILSAIASTGQVEPGDYISGIVNGDGSTIYFKGRSLQQIVQLLRGKPGSEVRLLMERASTEDGAEPYSFDLPIQRSMIVVQPPL